jgi:two-component system chemotaxis response regulator CheB
MPRILIADDSPTVRALLHEVLGSDSDIQIVGEARNGVEAVAMTVKLRPDAVTMDVEMPAMNGYDATKEIMVRAPTPVVIISGHVDDDDLERGTESFRAGALATFRKLPDVDAPEFDERATELLYIVNQLARVKVSPHWRIVGDARSRQITGDDRIRVVATAVSAKGSTALAKLLSKLPQDFAAPILVVPRVGSGFTDGFVTWLKRGCHLTVRLAKNGERLVRGSVYVAPEHRHLRVTGDFLATYATLSDEPPVRGFRPSATLLFDSAGEVLGRSVLALVLEGTGEDAIPGLCSIRLEGGRIIAQERADHNGLRSTGVDVAAALADIALPLDLVLGQLEDVHQQLKQRAGDSTTAPRGLRIADY